MKQESVGGYISDLEKRRGFSGAVMVTRMGTTRLRAAYGLANVEFQIPNTPETKFRIGSITKQFTAMIVMMLAERGKLSVRDRLVDRMAGLPRWWSDIRIQHLLNHTSGLMHSWDLPRFGEKIMAPYPLEAMIEDIGAEPLLFAPGKSCHYSGIGYFILARIIESVSGESFGAVLRKSIFEPLGMGDSGADSSVAIIPRRAAGYVQVAGVTQNAPFIYMQNLAGGGNLYSTVDDLGRWDSALTAGMFVSASSYRAMYTPEKEDYGYGWKVSKTNGRTVLHHGGSVNGFRAHIRRIPDEKASIIILSNNEDTGNYLEEMVETIQNLLEVS